MTWINTVSGKRVDLLKPDPESITFGDIAHALSRVNRFCGHIRQEHYSVAEHSVRCALAAERLRYSTVAQLACLLHDAHEAYINDICTPLKEILRTEQQWSAIEGIEKVFDALIWQKLGANETPYERMGGYVKHVDGWMCVYEAERVLLKREDWDFRPARDVALEQWRQPALGWSPDTAKRHFIARYRHLRRSLGAERRIAARSERQVKTMETAA